MQLSEWLQNPYEEITESKVIDRILGYKVLFINTAAAAVTCTFEDANVGNFDVIVIDATNTATFNVNGIDRELLAVGDGFRIRNFDNVNYFHRPQLRVE